MNIRTHHLVASVMVWAISVGSLAYLFSGAPVAHATCVSGASVVINQPINASGGSGTNNPLSGPVTLTAIVAPTGASSVSFMLLNPANQQSLGNATQVSGGWQLIWDTRNAPNGPNYLVATAHYGTLASYDCASATLPVNVNNVATATPKLTASISPSNWQGPVGATGVFNVTAVFTDQFGRQSNVAPSGVNWHSALGTVAPNGGISTVFTAGKTVGTGPLLADVMYGSYAFPATVTVRVTVATTSTSLKTPSPSPSITPVVSPTTTNATATPAPEPVSAADASRLSTMPTVFRPATPTNSDPVVAIPTLSCLEKAVGAVRFAEISNGSQPTAAERKLAAACFTGTEPMPAVLAPVPPLKLSELTTTQDVVTMGSVKAHNSKSKDGKTISGLLLSGTGAPNSDVFIYVFSDPLVLHATTDSKGAWSYVLETPLKAGKHEVYAVAQKDAATFVRTSAVPITVAAAAPGGASGGLVIESKYSRAQVGFAAGAFALVVGGVFIVILLLRRRRPVAVVATPAAGNPAIIMPMAPADSVIAPVTTDVPASAQPVPPAPAQAAASNPTTETPPNGPSA